jgi:hypothetical protein
MIYHAINRTIALLFGLILLFQGHAKKHPAPNQLARGGIKKRREENEARQKLYF